MSTSGRTETTLDPDKSRDYRILPVIVGQSSLLDQLLKTKPYDQFTANELKTIGLTYNEKSDYQNAKQAFTLALEKLMREALAAEERSIILSSCQYGLANIERELGNDAESIRRFRFAQEEVAKISKDAKEYGPLAYDIERNLGIAYLKVKDYKAAALCFENAIQLALALKREGLLPAVTSYHGLALVLSGDAEAGFAQLEKARTLYPAETREKSMDWAAHRYHMGRAFQETGDYINAISEFNESLRLRLQIIGPQIGSVYYNSRVGDTHAGLGQCYFSLKNFKTAALWLQKGLENYQALNNVKKVQETQELLSALPAPTSAVKNNTSPFNSLLRNKYLQYGLGASAALIGVSIFAYKAANKGRAADLNLSLNNSFRPK